MSKEKFSEGDKIRLTENHDDEHKGKEGVIKYVEKDSDGDIYYAVEFTTRLTGNGPESCNGHCRREYGLWIDGDDDVLELIGRNSSMSRDGGSGKVIKYKAGTSITEFVKGLLKSERDAERLKWLKTFDNCVLPKKVRDMVDEALTIVLRSDIFEEWGLNDQFEKGLTNSIMLWGPPGTGKTMVSESIAAVLGKNLMKVDNAAIQSNVPGKTEKNIKESFEKAKKNDAVILLDECDSLLYNRDAVGAIMGSHINCLLSEIENFDGICILTTNRLHKLDSALQRRIVAKIELPLPNKAARELIWKKLVPKKMPVGKEVDYKVLAEPELSGGEIKNAIILAARKAIAKNQKGVNMTDFQSVVIGIMEGKVEYDKRQPKRVMSREVSDGMGITTGDLERKTETFDSLKREVGVESKPRRGRPPTLAKKK